MVEYARKVGRILGLKTDFAVIDKLTRDTRGRPGRLESLSVHERVTTPDPPPEGGIGIALRRVLEADIAKSSRKDTCAACSGGVKTAIGRVSRSDFYVGRPMYSGVQR